MRYTVKQLRHDKMLAELLELTLEEVQEKRRAQDKNEHLREAEAILLFVERPEGFRRKKCQNPKCKQEFLTTYRFVSNCSTQCRVDSLERMGIIWNPMHTSDERWKRTHVPVEYSIPPAALATLLEIAKYQGLPSSTSSEQEQVLLDDHEPLEESFDIAPLNNDIHTPLEPSLPVSSLTELEADPELIALGIF